MIKVLKDLDIAWGEVLALDVLAPVFNGEATARFKCSHGGEDAGTKFTFLGLGEGDMFCPQQGH